MELSREITLLQRIGDESEYKEDMVNMFDHGMIVAMLTEIMAKNLGLGQEDINDITKAAMLHDIGKLRLSAYLYGRKNDLLDVEEIKYARTHPVLSKEILAETGIYNDNILNYVYHHHENFDGTGYPDKTTGDVTPLGARILHVCDTYVSLVSERPFRSAYDKETAITIMAMEPSNYDIELFMQLISILYSDEYEQVGTFISQANTRYLNLAENAIN